MLEHLILSALGRKPEAIRDVIQAELARLQRGGYLDPSQVERLTEQALEAVQAGVAGAQEAAQPLAEGTAAAIRGWLDVPSRAEVERMLAESQEPREAGGE